MIEDVIFVQCHVEGVEVTLSGGEWDQRTHFAVSGMCNFYFLGLVLVGEIRNLPWPTGRLASIVGPINLYAANCQVVSCFQQRQQFELTPKFPTPSTSSMQEVLR